jgi:transposase
MLTLPPSVRIYLAVEPTDMRFGIDRLAGIARSRHELDPFSGHLFVFLSRRMNRAKILFWDSGGFVLYYKRLEAGRFKMPRHRPGDRCVALSSTRLAMLLSGIDLSRVRKPRHWMPPGH